MSHNSDEVTRCLVFKYDWRGEDALQEGLKFQYELTSLERQSADSAAAARHAADSAAAWKRTHTISGKWDGWTDSLLVQLTLFEHADSTVEGSGSVEQRTENGLKFPVEARGHRIGKQLRLTLSRDADRASFVGTRTSLDILEGALSGFQGGTARIVLRR